MALSLILPQQLENDYLLEGNKKQTAASLIYYSKFLSSATPHDDGDNHSQNNDYSDSSDEVVLFNSPYEKKRRIALSKAILAMWPCLLLLTNAGLQYKTFFIPIIAKMALDYQKQMSSRRIIKKLILSSMKKAIEKKRVNNHLSDSSDPIYSNNQKETNFNKNNFFPAPHYLSTQGGPIDNQTNFFPSPSAPKLIETDGKFYLDENIKPSAPELPPAQQEEEGYTVEGEGGMAYPNPPKYNPQAIIPNQYGEQEGYNRNPAVMSTEPGNPYYDQSKDEIEHADKDKTSEYGESGEYANNKSTLFAVQHGHDTSLEQVAKKNSTLTNRPAAATTNNSPPPPKNFS